ncbi:helix-turn-helix domain-containing protein [Trichococcus flocculiformis]|uniref:helix-turn-helix domain-containing protein n=1 Tax=Trichococcus flocculiformis TaxID=82803 RepID=UPI002AABC2C4|nr:helix-turn-helix domain-containing protein [Trichococcus flocculiformis]
MMSDRQLTVEAKAIYAYFATCIGSEDTSSPTVGEISKVLNMSEERFRKHQKNLIERGYLTIRKNAAANGRYSTNVYVIQDRIANG